MPPKEKRRIKSLSIGHDVLEGNAAHHWRLLPWEFRALTSEQKAELVALYQVGREIEHYYNKESMRDDGAGSDTGNRRRLPKGK